MSVDALLARTYIGIPNRSTDVDNVRKELSAIVNALPTQIHPSEREEYINVILSDLGDTPDAPWTYWAPDLHLLSLSALKSLSRNPMGSQNLLETQNLETLYHHTSLPFPPSPSLFSHPPPHPTSPQALEALRVLANILVLHPAGRNRFAKAGGAKAIGRALAGKEGDGEYVDDEGENVDRLFLLGRIGFLVTMERKDAVGVTVDKEDVVDSLVHHLLSVPPMPGNFDALSELLKLTNNIIRFYPYRSPTQDWDDRFDGLLFPAIALLHTIPFTNLAPPLSHVLHVLLAIPWNERLLSTWHSAPADPPSPSSGGVRGLLNRWSNISSISSISSSSPSRKSSSDNGTNQLQNGNNLVPPRSRTPTPPSPVQKRSHPLPPRKEAPTALVVRVVKILETYLDKWLPWPKNPDGELERGLVIDENLPPILLLLSRAAEGSQPSRLHLKKLLLPEDLDRSPEAGPLEKRKSLLGTLLRFMSCTNHPQTKDTAGELLWSICDQDASTLSSEIGYGNAAGMLFRKGITAPPPGRFETITESERPTSPSTIHLNSSFAEAQRHPITALDNVDDMKDVLAGMTEEEKEREAERLFTLFDRMDRNPVISTQGANGEKKGVKDALREKYLEVDQGWGEKERSEREEEEKREEEEVAREMEAYRKRMGRK